MWPQVTAALLWEEMDGARDDEARLARLSSLRERAMSMHERIQQQNQQMELEWLQQDVGLLCAQLDRRHAFLSSIRHRQQADADLCAQVERQAAQMRLALQEQRLRQQVAVLSLSFCACRHVCVMLSSTSRLTRPSPCRHAAARGGASGARNAGGSDSGLNRGRVPTNALAAGCRRGGARRAHRG